MEIKGAVGRRDPGQGLNLRAGAGLDSFMFDSLINNFMTKETGRSSEQAGRKTEAVEDRQSTPETREPARAFKDSEISKPGKIRADSQKTERDSGPGKQGDGNEYGEINRQPVQPDKYADEGGKAIGHNPGTAKKDSASCIDNQRMVKDGANDLKASGLPLKSAPLSDNTADAATAKGAGRHAGNADAPAEDGLKVFNHAEGSGGMIQRAGGKENVQMKSAVMPDGVPKNTASAQTQADNQAALMAGAGKDPQSQEPGRTGTHSGFKPGHPLQEKTNESTVGKGINNSIEEMIRNQLKTSCSVDRGAGERDIPRPSANTGHTAGQYLVRQFQLQGGVTEAAGNNSARILSAVRPGSEFAGNLNREGGAGAHPKTARTARGHGSAGPADSGVIAHRGAKGKNIQHAGRSARPPAFNDVIEKIIYVAKGNNRLGVTIENETVGRLNINVSLNKGIINVHINAADNATREFVQGNIQHIVDSLAKSGVSVGGFSVGLRNHKGGEGSENRYAYDNGRGFDVDGRHENAYPEPIGNAARSGTGMVSVFA